VAEDAYISFRVSENLLAGYGLRWNIADRVQTYTDPLYLALVTFAAWISGNIYLASIVVSLLLTAAAIFLIAYGARFAGLALAVLALGLSKGFIDYSVSGLENPATHLAIAGYLFLYWRKRDPFLLSLVAALAATNREDTLLFLLPSLCLVYFRTGWKVLRPALAGWSPFIAWSLFSLFYYGFLFPNTAYAKLNTGIPAWDLMHRGLLYYSNAWRWPFPHGRRPHECGFACKVLDLPTAGHPGSGRHRCGCGVIHTLPHNYVGEGGLWRALPGRSRPLHIRRARFELSMLGPPPLSKASPDLARSPDPARLCLLVFVLHTSSAEYTAGHLA
jgi:hypothetical protein